MINSPKTKVLCPICKQPQTALLHHFGGAIDALILENLDLELPGWTKQMGACSRCVDQAQIENWEIAKKPNPYTDQQEYTILPISKRLGAHPDYTGKGVTICFIDSGFYPHPDVVNRVLAMEDLSGNEIKQGFTIQPEDNSWHGTMTMVAGAGDGSLSAGYYKSLAPDAQLVLLKVADESGKISGSNISKAILWAIKNQDQYGIRIINLSVSDDWSTSFRANEVDQAIQQAVEKGIVVVAAAGNEENALLKAPANSPHAITVGGLDDHNSLHPLMHNLYHSTFGTTIDGIQKPDLIAPAIWIPVPILPFTKTHRDAKLLFELLNTTDEAYLKAKHTNVAGELGVNPLSKPANASEIRQALEEAIALRKLISPHYLHGDGTSFAAPIVSSIVAQLLEANPGLSPSGVRTVLTQTARKLPYAPIDRQGYGVVHPLSALCSLDNVEIPIATDFTPLINYRTKTIEFELFREAHHAALTGDFTQWNPEGLPLVESSHKGAWKRCEVLFSPGVYRYKYILNNNEWIADVSNLYRELDGMGGFNSKLFIE